MRELTDDEQDAYAEHFYGALPPAEDPVCEWCEAVVPNGESDYPPYCSAECEREAGRETYASVHPRPEDVG
jgi:hypothetical protein